MNLRYRPTIDQVAAPSDHVLLEHWTAFGGHQLALRVTTSDAANPDVVAVQVRYGSGQTEVIVRADEQESSEASESASVDDQTPGPVVGVTVQHKQTKPCLSDEQEETKPSIVDIHDDDAASTKGTSSSEAEEQAPLAVDVGDHARTAETEQGETTACTSGEEQHEQEPPAVVAEEEAASASTEQTVTSSSSIQGPEDSGILAGRNPNKQVDAAKEVFAQRSSAEETPSLEVEEQALPAVDNNGQALKTAAEQSEVAARTSNEQEHDENPTLAETSSLSSQEPQNLGTQADSIRSHQVDTDRQQSGQSAPSGQEQRGSASLAEKTPKKAVELVEERVKRASDITNPMEANHSVAKVTLHPREDSTDVSRTRRKELRIGRFDPPAVLDDNRLEALLRDMPGLTCLSIDWREDGRKLDIDIVSRYCRNLVEVDLSRFRLDAWSLEQLCIACPGLEVVKLPRKSDDSCVEVLLRNLPKLRSLDLSNTNVTGQFLRRSQDSLEKLSLAGCKSLKFGNACQGRWENVRELDLSSTDTTSAANLAYILRHFPLLERLCLAHCGKFQPDTLFQVTLCKYLHDLDASYVGDVETFYLFSILIQCPHLERLSVAGCIIRTYRFQRQPYQGTANLRLRHLNISNVRQLGTNDLTAILAHCPQLERLLAANLDGRDLTDCLTQLSKCAELRELDISRSGSLIGVKPKGAYTGYYSYLDSQTESKQRELNCRQIQPAVLTSLLSGCQKLERLALAGFCFTESAVLGQLGQFPQLRDLDVSWVTTLKAPDQGQGASSCQTVDAADLARSLNDCQVLERLSVAGVEAPLEQLVPPKGLPNLTYLDASQSGLTNNSLRRLPGLCPKLQTLNIQGCASMKKDALMNYLPRLRQLRSLDVRDIPGVTDAVLESLKGHRLAKLRVGGSKCSAPTNGLLNLVLGCPSLRLVMLEESDMYRSDEHLFRQHLPSHRVLVMCYAKIEQNRLEQAAPLFVLGGDAVNWDDSDESIVLRDGN